MPRKKKNPCMECEAICCRNLAIPLTKPKNRYEVETYKWKLHFNTVQIYIKNNRWHLWIHGKCIYLSKENLCTNYEHRHQICRDHESSSCEMTGDWYDVMISRPEELETYLKEIKQKKKLK